MYVAIVEAPPWLPVYSVHQYLYSYFPQHPVEGRRPFLFRQSGHRCLLLSRDRPACPALPVRLTAGRTYAFESVMVPMQKPTRGESGRLIDHGPLLSHQERRAWLNALFERRGGRLGFNQWFDRPIERIVHGNGHVITYCPAQVKGMVWVEKPDVFSEMLLRGMGAGKAFGHGLVYLPELMEAVRHGRKAA